MSFIIESILMVYREFGITSFPIDCIKLLSHYGLKIYTYDEIKEKNEELYSMCTKYSDDAFCFNDIVFYNQKMPAGRINFSLMHELGHIILDTDSEQEANVFASHILAPRMAIHYARCNNEVDVANIFGLTPEAGLYAFNDYKKWYRQVVYHKMSHLDKILYSHFYNQELERFVYKISMCECGVKLYNTSDKFCDKCKRFNSIRQKAINLNNSYDFDFEYAENNWLYGGL